MKLHKVFFLILGIVLYSHFAQADCKDPELRQKVTETAKSEGVSERELLSIIAHESRCHYFTIAWNQPGQPQTAKSKFLDTLEDAKRLAEELISTRLYRVDVGIGQINNEVHIQPKAWSLTEVLNPTTALSRVAKVLKERGWTNYHSSNPVLAKKWQGLALAALDDALEEKKIFSKSIPKKIYSRGELIVFNGLNSNTFNKVKPSWIIYGNL